MAQAGLTTQFREEIIKSTLHNIQNSNEMRRRFGSTDPMVKYSGN